jgi:alpha-L-fucosidase
MCLDRGSWGYRRNSAAGDYVSAHEVIEQLVSSVSCGGNVLLNVGPTSDGMIPPIMEERLRQIGDWLNVNGEAIYGTRPWTYQNDTVTMHVWLV